MLFIILENTYKHTHIHTDENKKNLLSFNTRSALQTKRVTILGINLRIDLFNNDTYYTLRNSKVHLKIEKRYYLIFKTQVV